MIVDDMVRTPGSWLGMKKPTGIVISSRIRLARNIEGVAFPGWAGEQERVQLLARLKGCFTSLASMPNTLVLEMAELAETDRDVLRERHLISQELAERGSGSALAISPDEQIAIMVNEEDHLRLQAIAPGMQLRDIWDKINAVDSEIEDLFGYAFSPQLGYLTACPSNVGTGLRASVMMHLAGLRLTNEVESVINGLEKIGLTVRGLWGEGTEAYGNMFQVSNQQTLGHSEAQIIDAFIELVTEVTQHEKNARARLAESQRVNLIDWVARAYGLLKNARIMSSQEKADLLSALRLGIEMGYVGGVDIADINQIMLMGQPGHLQKSTGRVLGPEERDTLRARLTRNKLQNAKLLE
ncbi:MAG: protein arginine kinase [Candidatus Promineifilaceae bacterium]